MTDELLGVLGDSSAPSAVKSFSAGRGTNRRASPQSLTAEDAEIAQRARRKM